MSVEKQLARVTAGRQLTLTIPGHGPVELSRDDIKAAMGYAEYARRQKRPKKIKTPLKTKPDPLPAMGMHIVLAKWTDDHVSKRILEEQLAHLAFQRWWRAEVPDTLPISRALMRKIARLMIMDMREPRRVTEHGADGIEKMTGLDEDSWKRYFSRHYAHLIKECSQMEADVLQHIRRAIA